MNSKFTENEIVTFERWDKKKKKNVVIKFPVVGGRLRLYHEDLAQEKYSDVASGIDITVIKYENDVAVIQARVCINGNAFTGIGMASKSRDSLIYPAILEMAETRAIARALRFAGYGVEYTGAEEMEGVKKFDETSVETSVETSEKTSDLEPSRDVNDDVSPDTKLSEDEAAPSLKRQVWEYVTSEHSDVQENYLAAAMKKFSYETAEKYDGDVEQVYGLVLDNKERFLTSFEKYITWAVPEIKAPAVVKDEKYWQENPEAVPEVDPVPEDAQKELNKNMSKAAASMKLAPPPPVVDEDKVKKANIYREMPDGVSVAALNGTLATLLSENPEHSPGDIYDMVLGDIEGFVKILEEWSKKNDVPSGIKTADTEGSKEAAPDKEQTKSDGIDREQATDQLSDKEFRKSWVRLDWENFFKFIILNSDRFKSNKDEYTKAVEKFDRLKAKTPETKDQTFPYLFSYQDVIEPEAKISAKDSVIEEVGQERSFLNNYRKSVPAITTRAADHLKIDPENCSELEASMINEQIEAFATQYEKENGTPYMEAK